MLNNIINTIVSAIVLYLLGLGGKYLQRYLKRRFPALEERAAVKSTSKAVQKGEKPAASVAKPALETTAEATPEARPSAVRPATRRIEDIGRRLEDMQAQKEEARLEGEFVYYKDYRWWVLSLVIIALSIGMSFLAGWILYSILGIFEVETPYLSGAFLVLSIAGIIWGITYIISGTSFIEAWYEVFFAVVEPYGDFFDSFLTTIMVALPFNILIAWGIANGVGIAVELIFGAGYPIAVYVTLAVITCIQLWIMNEEYLYL